MRINNKIGISGIAATIIAAVLYLEGGYSNDPNDPGGETNHGITESVARDYGYTGPMVDLPREFAERIYIHGYIEKPNFDLIIQHSPAVGHKMVDAGVNVGAYRASTWFQIALNALNRGGKDYPNVVVDGRIGPNTVRAYAELERKRGSIKACQLVVKLIDAQQAMHYINLKNLTQYTVGWVDHRIGNVHLSECVEYRGAE